MGFLARLMGEEPGFFDTLFHYENVGQFGEYATEFAVKNNISGYGSTLHNIYLPLKSCTTEIDVLLIHEKGLFVFESKNYGGWIFGGAEQQKWTQCFPNGEKHPFYNPVKQNATHCAALSRFLGVSPQSVFSCIVFSERCELKKVPEDTPGYMIVRRPDLLRKLRGNLSRRPVLFSREQVDAFVKRLQSAANVPSKEKQAHVEKIRAQTEGTVCPYCGASLVKRQGKYGAFYGCSSYPSCKFTRNIK